MQKKTKQNAIRTHSAQRTQRRARRTCSTSRAHSAEQGAHAIINSSPPHERAAPSSGQTKKQKTTKKRPSPRTRARARQRRRFGSDDHNRHDANDVIVDRRRSTWRSDSSRHKKNDNASSVRIEPTERRSTFSQQHKQRTQHDNKQLHANNSNRARHVQKQTKKSNCVWCDYLHTQSRTSVTVDFNLMTLA